MKPGISSQLRRAVAETLQHFCGISTEPERLRLPAHPHAVRLYLPEPLEPEALGSLLPLPAGELFSAPLIGHWTMEGRLLLLDFTADFYSALVYEILSRYPAPERDLGIHALNRLIRLGRRPEPLCPDDPAVQSTLLMGVCMDTVGLPQFLQQLERMEQHSPRGRARQALMDASGGVYAALARLLYAKCSSERNEII